MAEEHDKRRVPLLLWPFWAIWRLFALIVGLTGRLIAAILGFVLMIVGLILTVTVVGAVIGVPLMVIGFFLALRSIF